MQDKHESFLTDSTHSTLNLIKTPDSSQTSPICPIKFLKKFLFF